jgi:hypothetical protein
MRRQPRHLAASLAIAAALLLPAGAARADDYETKRAGHPLRIIAYVLHPVGVIVDRLVLRPAHWLGHHEPIKTLFGHTD